MNQQKYDNCNRNRELNRRKNIPNIKQNTLDNMNGTENQLEKSAFKCSFINKQVKLFIKHDQIPVAYIKEKTLARILIRWLNKASH